MKIELYTQDRCPKCIEVKNILKELNQDWIEYNITKDSAARNRLIFELDAYTTPTLVLNGVLQKELTTKALQESLLK